MKLRKKCLAVFLAVFLFAALLSGTAIASADWTDTLCYELVAARDADVLYLAVVATEDLSTSGLNAAVSYDESVFTLESAQVAGDFSFALNSEDGKLVLFTGDEPKLAKGEALATLVFAVSDSVEADKEYRFDLEITEAFGFELEDYAWVPATISTTYTASNADGQAEQTTPVLPVGKEDADSYTVTYKDSDGKILYVESIEKGETVTEPDPPVGEGRFAGWTVDGALYDFDSAVTGDITLTATWTEESEEVAPAEEAPAEETPAVTPESVNTKADDRTEEATKPDDDLRFTVTLVIAAAIVVLLGIFFLIRGRKKSSR